MKNSQLLLLTLLLFFSCKKEDTPPLLPNELATIAEIKAVLSKAKEDSNLIISIDTTEIDNRPYYAVHFENEDQLLINGNQLKEVNLDKIDWEAYFLFEDNCDQLAPYLGTLNIITPVAVTLNPFGNAPLTATVKHTMPVKGKFSVKVLGKGANGLAISHEFDLFSEKHEFPILGLYADYNNEVEITFKSEFGKFRDSTIINIQTESGPAPARIDLIKNDLPADDQGIYFISELKTGFDLQGEVRWYYTGDAFYIYRKTKNGNLIFSGQEGGISYHRPHFYEVSMLGEVINRYEVPNFQHHEIIELPNSNFLVATNSTLFDGNRNDGNLEEDVIIEIDRTSGEVVKSWDFNLILDNQRDYPGNNNNTDDWLHLNSLFFDETDNSILLSSKHQSTVAKIDYETGDIIWILAHPSGWSGGQEDFILTPVDENEQPIDITTLDFLPYYQHNAMLLPNGNLWLYDNGNYRGYYDNPASPDPDYTRVAEYKINAAQKTVQLVWSYTYPTSIFTAATGDVDYNPQNGHRLAGFMQGSQNSPKIIEFNENKEVILDVNINQGKYYYRFEKMNLY